jgi:hypothetical protein
MKRRVDQYCLWCSLCAVIWGIRKSPFPKFHFKSVCDGNKQGQNYLRPDKTIILAKSGKHWIIGRNALKRAVPWLRQLVTGLSPRGPGFAPGSIRVGFMVDKVALRQVFLRVLRFSPVSIIQPSLSTLISSGE